MKISFDFDSTLSRKDVQSIVIDLITKGYEVWIVTSRCSTEATLEILGIDNERYQRVDKQNQKLFDVAEKVGIPKDRIVFTNHVDKIEYLKGKGFIVHVDDDPDELMAIFQSDDPCKVVNVDHSDWLYHFNEIIK
jgi:hypothetical protein